MSISYFYFIPKFEKTYYNQGVQEGNVALVNGIWNSQSIPRIYLEGNETKIQQVSFNELCNAIGGGQ